MLSFQPYDNLGEGCVMVNDNGFVCLSNKRAECKISLWGGNLVSYRPKNEDHDVFWLGGRNKFDNVQAIRGGIPVCWPRVAEEKLNNNLPRHGFARISLWNLKNVAVNEDQIEAELSLTPADGFNVNAIASLFIRITDKLEYRLETVNCGDAGFDFSEALHAYFNVSSVENVTIKGLAGHRYKNSLDGNFYTLDNDLKIKGEVDSIFIGHTKGVEIEDTGFKRIISVEKTGSDTTVVWNPAKDLAEMEAGQYKKFVCVEPSNQEAAFVRLKPHEKHIISMNVQVKKLI